MRCSNRSLPERSLLLPGLVRSGAPVGREQLAQCRRQPFGGLSGSYEAAPAGWGRRRPPALLPTRLAPGQGATLPALVQHAAGAASVG